jgi:hypothetical protein
MSLEATLKISEKAREQAEKDVAAVERLRGRLKTVEDTLSDKEAQQIERENARVMRFETQNRKFTSKLLLHLPFASAFVCLSLMLTNSWFTPIARRPQRRGRSSATPAGGQEDLDCFCGLTYQFGHTYTMVPFSRSIKSLINAKCD